MRRTARTRASTTMTTGDDDGNLRPDEWIYPLFLCKGARARSPRAPRLAPRAAAAAVYRRSPTHAVPHRARVVLCRVLARARGEKSATKRATRAHEARGARCEAGGGRRGGGGAVVAAASCSIFVIVKIAC